MVGLTSGKFPLESCHCLDNVGKVLDTVKTYCQDQSVTATTDENAKGAKTYHHGDLPAALRAATAELITEKGPTGFSLREVARRAGVSHSAPAHHFGDSVGLLTSVAAEGFALLVAAFEEVISIQDPIERLTAMGTAYVRNALDHPGHFGVMCVKELVDGQDEAFLVSSARAFELLTETVAEIAGVHNPDLNIEAAATFIWTAVHGLSILLPTFDDAEQKSTPEGIGLFLDQYTDLIVNGLLTATATAPEADVRAFGDDKFHTK